MQAIKTLDRLAQLTEGTWSTAQRAELRLAINSMILAEAALNTSEPASGVDGSPRARATSVQNVVALCQALARD